MKIPFNIFRILSFLIIILISITGYQLLGNIEDSTLLEYQKSKWNFSKNYANLTINDDLLGSNITVDYLNDIYKQFKNSSLVYFDNNEFSDYETEMYGELSANKIKDVEVDKYSAITVNNEYLKINDLSMHIKSNDINVLIPSSLWNQKDKIMKSRCIIDRNDKDVKIKDCNATETDDKNIFVGALLDNANTGMHKAIIVVYSDDFIENEVKVDSRLIFLKYDSNSSYDKNYTNIMNSINNKKIFSEDGLYTGLFNKSVEYSHLEDTMATGQLIITIALVIFLLVIIYFIYNIINIYIGSMIKEIMIKKTSGYSLLARYQSLLLFLIFCFLLTTWLIWLYLLMSKSGSLTVNYLFFIIFINLLIILISYKIVNKLEKKSILNILKGDNI
ncbi:hypothetical protein [Mycoplasma sp. P36-A1]|uniref:hypothetical protein n=1 Tax=Mycoplasma sp. P36-A1 TaxID=3252900 RepID=UPI003C2D22D7